MAHRDFTSIIIDNSIGPSVTIGDATINFKAGQPLTAVLRLLDEAHEGNALIRSQDYLRAAVHADSAETLEAVFPKITAVGLSELVEWVAQEYSGFPTENSPASSPS